jgi:prepilin peptidase CpaA
LLQSGPWIPAVAVAISAGVLDWLTVSGLVAGVAVNTALSGWGGLRSALLGAALALGVLLPFVLLRSLGAGDWKLAGALGACVGPRQLISVLLATVWVAGVMALGVVIYKGRVKQTLRNIAHMLAAFFRLRMPASEVSLDNPQSSTIPFGVAMALAALLYALGKTTGRL